MQFIRFLKWKWKNVPYYQKEKAAAVLFLVVTATLSAITTYFIDTGIAAVVMVWLLIWLVYMATAAAAWILCRRILALADEWNYFTQRIDKKDEK
jgi:hypothetical protein